MGLVFLLVLLVTAAVFPGTIEFDGLAPVFWALLLLAPYSAIAMSITVPTRRLVCASLPPLTHRCPAGAAFGWLSAFLVGLMLLEWMPGVHAHSVLPAVVVATVGLLLEPLAQQLGGSKTKG
ncbi:hypothetical protein ABZV31_25230 [Streptomyces sp. NPDC005202]|uniref:hypothetical protein n=1 Tax=Streptomyces sp. NPDC005202 TaxID=3157021 RepID=UPI0033B9094E